MLSQYGFQHNNCFTCDAPIIHLGEGLQARDHCRRQLQVGNSFAVRWSTMRNAGSGLVKTKPFFEKGQGFCRDTSLVYSSRDAQLVDDLHAYVKVNPQSTRFLA